MSLREYVKQVKERHVPLSMLEAALGLASEAGEVAQIMRKSEFERNGVNVGWLVLELGDVLHYVAEMCAYLDIEIEDVAALNKVKMKALDRGEREYFESMMALWEWPGESLHEATMAADVMLNEVRYD